MDIRTFESPEDSRQIPKQGFGAASNTGVQRDEINPDHYKTSGKEVWEQMIDLYGLEKYLAFCELNAFKYRMRAGKKDDTLTDIKKAMWYESKLEELSRVTYSWQWTIESWEEHMFVKDSMVVLSPESQSSFLQVFRKNYEKKSSDAFNVEDLFNLYRDRNLGIKEWKHIKEYINSHYKLK